MLPLFIIEDNTAQRELIEKVIRDYIIIREMDVSIVLYQRTKIIALIK